MAVAFGLFIYSGIHGRVEAASTLQHATELAAIEDVIVVSPKAAAPIDEVVLPGATQPYVNSPIYARTNGYLVKWFYDIGAKVKQGDLLAIIDTPELDKQLEQARADLETAKSNLALSKTTADRWQGLVKTRSVSQQSTDQAVDNLSATQASVDSYAANVRRLEDLVSFEKVYAPFDGVITVRNTDTGWLINAGAGSPSAELFQLAQTSTLRIFVAVPEVYSRAARVGSTATLTLDEFPSETFHGKVTRTSQSIDMASRTLNTEIDVDNPSGQLLPGAYVHVHLKLPSQSRSVIIPANTLLFRSEGLRVGVVRNGHAQLTPITIGVDYGDSVQVTSGLTPADQVIVSPSDSLISGTPVRVTKTAACTTPTPAQRNEVSSPMSGPCPAGCCSLGCMVGPKYQKPPVPVTPAFKEPPPDSFKESDDWKRSHPDAAALRGNWWEIFGDPQLNALEEQVTVSNQDLKMAEARFRQARTMVRYNRASEFPTIGVDPNIQSLRYSPNQPYFPANVGTSARSAFTLPFDLSYEVDLWGRIRRTVTSAGEEAQATAADLETAALSLHAELAVDYFELRSADAQQNC